MDRRHVVLILVLLGGCSRTTHVEVPYEPPIKTDTTFANLPQILSAIPKSSDVRLYRGLPSEFWEPELRTKELGRARTIRLHGYPFYEPSEPIPRAEADRLTALLSSRATFRRHNGRNQCGGYSPEFCIEWKAGEGGIRALICVECSEVKLFAFHHELYCGLTPEAKQALEATLVRLQRDRTSGIGAP